MKQMHIFSLYLGGADGGVYVAASTAKIGLDRHLIEVLEDDTTFSVLTGTNLAGATVDMVDAGNNNLGARTYNKGDLVYAPYGGSITAYTCDKSTMHYSLPAN